MVDQAELKKAALDMLEFDEGILPEEVNDIEISDSLFGNCTVSFPKWNITYYASFWPDGSWLFLK
jgi:hypothetical protein